MQRSPVNIEYDIHLPDTFALEEHETLLFSLKNLLQAARLLGYTIKQEFGTDLTDPEGVFVITSSECPVSPQIAP